jgi:hypothetical protein
MKVLVSTKEGQGKRKNDFSFVPEGELLTLGLECDGESVDGSCGCRRSLCGVECHKATTTFKVEDRVLTKEKYINILQKSLSDGGWFKDNPKECRNAAITDAECLLQVANHFSTGIVIERRGERYQWRNALNMSKGD